MGRAEKDAAIREVLIALGGSPEALDRAKAPNAEESSGLDSRISAYTRLASARAAPAVVAEPVVATAEVAAPVVHAPARPRPRKARPAQRRTRSVPSGKALVSLVAAAATIAAAVVVVQHRHLLGGSGHHQSGVAAAARSGVSRAGFTDPHTYAASMTSLSLANGGSEVDGQPACNPKSTWRYWACTVKARPSVGPYADHWVTFRCRPHYARQPGGRPAALLIDCRPLVPG